MNTKLRCILLDDELPGLTYLRMMCEQFPGVEVVKSYNDPLKFVNEINQYDFDLCILDVEMPGMNGLQVAQLLKGKPVIFTTAYKEYAAEAFEVDAIDYIRKPIKADRLEKALKRAEKRFLSEKKEKEFIQVNTSKGKTILYFNQLLYITTSEPEKRDKSAFLQNGQVLTLKNISFDELLGELPAHLFCRVNKKDIIALRAIRFFAHNEIILSLPGNDEKRIVLSENYAHEFRNKTT
ncbi:MAG: LytR/AlgR family response regulator transcription factor [Bacteroidota bacterium]